MRCGNAAPWKAMENAFAFTTPSHSAWVTLRVTHITTTTTAADLMGHIRENRSRSILQKVLDTTKCGGAGLARFISVVYSVPTVEKSLGFWYIVLCHSRKHRREVAPSFARDTLRDVLPKLRDTKALQKESEMVQQLINAGGKIEP